LLPRLGKPIDGFRRNSAMSDRIILRTGEALVEGAEDYLCAEPEVVIGELDGPVGHALANLIGDQVKGHTRVFAILNSDFQVRPATVMVRKVTLATTYCSARI
jgi:formaldehyde-activating enzyme